MIFKTNLGLSNLHCVTPTDPSGEDEPYLWVFFLKADGSNIRQRTGDPFHLSANITIVSGSGRPGNLGVSGVRSGGNIHISPKLGVFDDALKPIVLTLNQAGATIRIFVPSRIAVFCIAIDEDSAPRDAMETAFNEVKSFIQFRLNDFLNSLDLQSMATEALTSPNPEEKFQSLFTDKLEQFTQQIQKAAVDFVEFSALVAVIENLDWWNPVDIGGAIATGLDPDEPIGRAQFMFSEQEILDNNLHLTLHKDLRQSRTGLGGAWYILNGYLNATVSFNPSDIKLQILPEVSQPIGSPQEYTFQSDHIFACVYAGSSIQIARIGHAGKYQIFVDYPFAGYRYTLDGQVLSGNSGTLLLSKEVRFPEFDENSFMPSSPFVKYRRETRQVKVQFEKRRLPNDPQIEQLFIANDPGDGNYDLLLKVEAVLNNGGVLPVGSEAIIFEGQTIELPPDFLKSIKDCLENFVGTKWAKSKRLTLKDLWGPVARRRQYEETIRELDALATVGAFDKQSVEAAKNIIAAKLKIKQH
jgi:hypothetical protein